MKYKKIPYYLFSLSLLFKLLSNKFVLLSLLINRQVTVILCNKWRFKIKTILDGLILKETIIDDFYRLKSIKGKNPKLIVDIGAGFGDFSIFAAKLFPNATIYSFEPNPALFALLNHNIKANRIKNIRTSSYAIGKEKEITLFFSHELTQTTFKPKQIAQKTITVKAKPLFALFSHKRINFLKIDCEGGEWDIVRSLSTNEKKRIDYISMEYHNFIFDNIDKKIEKCLQDAFKITIIPNRYDSGFGLLFARKKYDIPL